MIDPRNTWVISDTHFGHNNIVDYCRRPAEHEDILVEEWNAAVPDSGVVLHLGDLSYRNNAYFKNIIAKKLSGNEKLLILGNHDKQRFSFYRDSGFKIVKPFNINYDKHVVSFSHYALRKSPGKKLIHVHGHIHNNGYGGKGAPFVPFSDKQINVSAEQIHYRPVNLADLLNGYLVGCYESDWETT